MNKPANEQHFDVLIIGSGAAGLGLALSLANNTRVALLSKSDLLAGSSQRAQGGIAAVMDNNDSYEAHIQDTLIAGAGLCHPDVVAFTVKNAKSAIEWLISQGVQFTTDGKAFHLNQEGGHSRRRILHAADKTGSVVVNTLAEQVLQHHNITCLTEHTAIELLVDEGKCFGAVALDNDTGNHQVIYANLTVLATGGASTAYLHTSNPDYTSGDGIAMAYHAGCRIGNLEFNQFHPTCFYHPNAKPFLISEAVRGEGGHLLLPNGERFMSRYDHRLELAPRDIVARAIDQELKINKINHVYLDISHKPTDKIKQYFPTIAQFCLKHQIDITKDPIPVVPAAHYTCGGIITNMHGQTDIQSLFAIGEVACTGLHGANRMASNSLLECLVFAMSAGKKIQQQLKENTFSFKSFNFQPTDINQNSINIDDTAIQLRTMMWNEVGIVRNNQRLMQAQKQIYNIQQSIASHQKLMTPNKKSIELQNLLTVCELIVRCAIQRKESRGLHYTLDHPKTLDHATDTILTPATNCIIA